MADNFIERHQAEYEARKKKWLLRKKHIGNTTRTIEKQEDEAL